MKKKDFEDDGRQIADMSGTYQSWYGLRMGRDKPKKKTAPKSESDSSQQKIEPEPTKKEIRQVAANAILAAMLLGAVFIGAAFLFLLFCTKVWFK